MVRHLLETLVLRKTHSLQGAMAFLAFLQVGSRATVGVEGHNKS